MSVFIENRIRAVLGGDAPHFARRLFRAASAAGALRNVFHLETANKFAAKGSEVRLRGLMPQPAKAGFAPFCGEFIR